MFLDLCFPVEVADFLAEKVTEYVGFCTTPSDRKQARHEATSTTKGHCEVPEVHIDGIAVRGFERMHVYGVLGILITMGITQKRRMTDHWGVSLHDNYPLIRNYMPRDLFLLFYSRFMHMASAALVGKDHPDYDSLHHIRELEDHLNKVWSTIVTPGASVSFDEQMIKSTAIAMRGILRLNPLKSIKHGIKGWAVTYPSGWTYVQVVDGGSSGNKKLRPTDKCPLGRTTRMVLHVLLKACPEFGRQLDGSGVSVAMDNYFTSATLLLCLATHDIFAVGTVRKNRMGMSGALQYWKDSEESTTDRGDMLFARNGHLTVVEWVDSKVVHFMSSMHIFESDFVPLEFEKRAKGLGAGMVDGIQPYLRYIYVKYMGGVDLADQYNMSHSHQHRPQTFFWRRVFDQKFAQATSNAYLLFVKWAEDLLEECKLEIQEFTVAMEAGPAAVAARTVAKEAERAAMAATLAVGATAPGTRTGAGVEGPGALAAGTGAARGTLREGGGATTPILAPLSLEELSEYRTLLEKVRAMERVQWDQRLADELMSRCQVDHAQQGGRRVQHPVVVATYDNNAAESGRVYWGDRCRAKKKRRFDGGDRSKTRGLCWCDICSFGKGKEGAVYLCKTCNEGNDTTGRRTDAGHRAAAAGVSNAKVKKARAVKWAR